MVQSVYQIDGRQDEIVVGVLNQEIRNLLQTHGPVVRATMPFGGDGWLVLGYDAARELASSPDFSTAALGESVPRMRENGGIRPPWPRTISMIDPPEHTAKRRMLTKHLSLKRVLAMEERTTRDVETLLDSVVEQGPGVDIIPEFVDLVPLQVLCHLLGVDLSERHRFVPAARTLMNGQVSDPAAGDLLIESIKAYFAELIDRRRRAPEGPGDDLLSALIQDHEASDVFTEDDLRSLGFTLLSAGHEVTTAILGGMLLFLAHSPQWFQTLKADERQIPQALEEFLRYLPAGIGMRTRVATRDVEIGGVLIRRGEGAIYWTHAANLDEATFDDPEGFHPQRQGSPHLRFGFGVHACLGQQLARMELGVVLRSVLRRFDRFEALDVSPQWRQQMLLRGPKSLRVTW